MQIPAPESQHLWLKKFIGEWTYESEAVMGPDQPVMKSTGTESVRAIGDFWILGEGKGTMPDGNPATMLLTIGYDPAKGKFVGTWLGSMMAKLWIYEGTLDGNKLSLHCLGPSFDGDGEAEYIDATEFVSDEHRILTSSVKGKDGNWTTFMTAHYRRKK